MNKDNNNNAHALSLYIYPLGIIYITLWRGLLFIIYSWAV